MNIDRLLLKSRDAKVYEKELDLFSRYLLAWVAICIVIGLQGDHNSCHIMLNKYSIP